MISTNLLFHAPWLKVVVTVTESQLELEVHRLQH